MIIYIAIAVNWKTLPYIHRRRRHCAVVRNSRRWFFILRAQALALQLAFFFASLVMLATRTGHLNFNEWLNDKRRSIPQHPCTYTHGSSYVRNHSSSNHNMMNRLIERRLVCEPSGVRCSRFFEWFSAIAIISTLWTVGPHWCGQMATHKLQSFCIFVCNCYWLIFIIVISFARHAFFTMSVLVYCTSASEAGKVML